MTIGKLALFGGMVVRKEPFPPYPVIDDADKAAVMAVLDRGALSTFGAGPKGNFAGGIEVQALEKEFSTYNSSKFALAVNSGTAGLHCALAAVGVGPGDEVIVPSYTFTSTATSVLMHNAIPVFCDVDPETFCIDPDKVESLVSKQTKAIVPVHLLGHPADMPQIMAIAEKNGIHVVEDSAQALGASINGIRTGNFGHMGVFSFQETKNLPVGEGGMVTTSDERLAERVRMIRNHGESILLGKSREYISNIIGWNYRMTEMEAALGRSQLKKVVRFDTIRKELFEYLLKHLDGFPGIQVPIIKGGFIHGYHIFGMIYNASSTGVSRERLIEALQAEGVPVGGGYRRPLYDNPIFKDLKGYGDQGCPFRCGFYKGSIDYNDPQCPVAEALVSENALWLYVVRPPATIADMDDIVGGFKKVWSSMDRLCDSDE